MICISLTSKKSVTTSATTIPRYKHCMYFYFKMPVVSTVISICSFLAVAFFCLLVCLYVCIYVRRYLSLYACSSVCLSLCRCVCLCDVMRTLTMNMCGPSIHQLLDMCGTWPLPSPTAACVTTHSRYCGPTTLRAITQDTNQTGISNIMPLSTCEVTRSGQKANGPCPTTAAPSR